MLNQFGRWLLAWAERFKILACPKPEPRTACSYRDKDKTKRLDWIHHLALVDRWDL